MESFRHTIDAANSLEKAHAASFKSRILHFPQSYRFKGTLERKFRDELWLAANLYRKSKRDIKDEFRARWFVWRAVFPISIIVGVNPDLIFDSARSMFVPRALAVWIAYKAGDATAASLGKVIGRDRTTANNHIKRAENGVADPSSEFYKLLTDLLEFEAESS